MKKQEKFIPLQKMSKKKRRELAKERRAVWSFSPVSRRVEDKTLYDRKRKARDGYDDNRAGFFLYIQAM